ncbi:hypothetical protein TNCV_348371 [Trichonephila clavipes]|nr:hypothetical protein TNCV_348371 [Trichonephila clavipes]
MVRGTDLAPKPTDFSWTKWNGLHALGGRTRRIHPRRTLPTPSSVTLRHGEKEKEDMIHFSARQHNTFADHLADLQNYWGIPKVRQSSNSVAQQPMRARNYYAHPNIRDYWALRCMNRYPDLAVCLKRDLQCLRHQASFLLIYRPNAARMKGRVDLAHPSRPVVWKHDTLPLDPIR